VRQILLNLLSNGIKYNRPGGGVTLGCERITLDENDRNENSLDDAGEFLRFVVSDSGPGIPAEKLGKLFEPFERLGREGGTIEGTGLGLSVCKRLVEAMHGHIGVHSVEGEGSRFWVELPVVPDSEGQDSHRVLDRVLDEAQGSSEDIAEAKTRVLYVEDNASNLKLMQRILAHRPEVNLLTAVDGTTGLQMAQANCPDLILLDLQLPDMAGDMVLDRLHSDERTRDIPVVMLSADATPSQIKRLLAAGAHDYLTKPIEVQKFLHVLDSVLEEQTASSSEL
jgi:CheY-like chemotaxis protein